MKSRFPNSVVSLVIGLLATALVSLGPTPSLGAQDTPAGAPSSREILRQMSEALKAAQRISFHAEVSFDDPPAPGFLIQLAGAMDCEITDPAGQSLS